MRIAQIAPLMERVPPKLYGGTERVVSYLTEELVRLGHEVTLFASGDSETRAELVAVLARRCGSTQRSSIRCRTTVAARGGAPAGRPTSTSSTSTSTTCTSRCSAERANCTVTTLHGRLDLPDLQPLFREFPDMPLVSISDAQRRPLPPAELARHRVSRPAARPAAARAGAPGGYLAFLGRISPEKRPDRAIEIAERAGMPLRIAAKVDRVDERLLREKIAPLLDASAGRVRRRDRRAREGRVPRQRARRCCSRSTGPSRSAW